MSVSIPKTPILSEAPISTEFLVWAPKKKNDEKKKNTDRVKKKLHFESPSTPIVRYQKGWNKIVTCLTDCNCYLKAEACCERPCKCKKKRKIDEGRLKQKKKISLKCTCPVECNVFFQAGQEMF